MGHYNINLDRLKVLLVVAQTGSLTKAALELNMSISAISQQISRLEKEVKLPLIERMPRGIQTTPAGAALVYHAQQIDRNISAALSEISEYKNLNRGKLRISTFPTFAASMMPEVLSRYRKEFPHIELQVKSTLQQGIIDTLIRRESEIATLWDYSWMKIDEPDLALVPLMIEPTMLLVPESHRVAEQKYVHLSDLAQEKWITRDNHPVSSVLQIICQDSGFTPEILMLANDYQELQGMVAAELGLALAPKLAVLNPRPGIKVIHLVGNPAPRRILLAHHAKAMLSPAAQSAIEIFHEVSDNFQ